MAWNFDIVAVADVPTVRTSTALPLPWAQMQAKFESLKGKEFPSIVIPRKWWIEERGLTETAKNADGKLILTADNMGARIKASFGSYRAGIEKQIGKLADFAVVIEEQKDADGNWEGHRVYLSKYDIPAREEAIKRGQALAKKNKAKKPAKKTAAK